MMCPLLRKSSHNDIQGENVSSDTAIRKAPLPFLFFFITMVEARLAPQLPTRY